MKRLGQFMIVGLVSTIVISPLFWLESLCADPVQRKQFISSLPAPLARACHGLHLALIWLAVHPLACVLLGMASGLGLLIGMAVLYNAWARREEEARRRAQRPMKPIPIQSARRRR